MNETIYIGFLLPGLLIGLAAAFAPGPLMALLVSESLKGGVKAGARVAISPILTDVPFIVAAIIIAQGIKSSPHILAAISFLGAGVLTFLAFQNISSRQSSFSFESGSTRSLRKGMVVNLLNPNMYLYWFSVATPFFARGSTVGSTLFAGGLLVSSVVAMLFLTYGIDKLRTRIFKYAHWVLRGLGGTLLFFAYKLLSNGLSLLT